MLDTLRCPVDMGRLRLMGPGELHELNARIARGEATYACGVPVTEALEGGMVGLEGGSVYRIEGGVPVLVPSLRIETTPDGQAATAPGTTIEVSPLADVWLELSSRWHRIKPPLRPAPQVINLFERLVGNLAGGNGSTLRGLLLGVTPEIATMRWPIGTKLLAFDSSPAMIRNVWPMGDARNAVVIRADWKAMPLPADHVDMVIGDGILTSQRYPDDFKALAREVHRVLKGNGALVLRLFARPEENETVAEIFDDLRAGRIPNFDVLHWRLAMAMHGDLASGTRMSDVWDAWHANVPNSEELMTSVGWAPDAARIMESYRGLKTSISFPTVREVGEIFAGAFEQVACHVPNYDDGARYPTVLFRPIPGFA